ncbi:MAG: sulfatase [bacterium]
MRRAAALAGLAPARRLRPFGSLGRRRPLALLAGLALLALADSLAGCARRPPPPELVLVTLDTFRQDQLGCTGHPTVRTPYLDRLARHGTLWRDALTPIPLTTPSHASILSGLSPKTHRLLRNRMRLRDDVVTIAQRLRNLGYRTSAVVSNRLVLHPDLGLGRGFDTYDVIEPKHLPASGEGAQTVERAISRLADKGGARSFLWVHFFDAHLPYLPPEPWDRVYGAAGNVASPRAGSRADSLDPRAREALRARYAGEVSFVDRCVGRLARAMEERSDRAPSVLLITADHGEGLGDHEGYFGHDLQVYDTSLRVPMLVVPMRGGALPEARAGTVSTEAARTFDLAPTLAGLAGLSRDPGAEGRDLLHDPPPAGDARLLFAETHPEPEKGRVLYALRTEDSKVIWCPEERRWEFYDLRSDPGETSALARADSAGNALQAALVDDLRRRPVGSQRTIDEERGGLDEETRRALQSLGYVGGSGSP